MKKLWGLLALTLLAGVVWTSPAEARGHDSRDWDERYERSWDRGWHGDRDGDHRHAHRHHGPYFGAGWGYGPVTVFNSPAVRVLALPRPVYVQERWAPVYYGHRHPHHW